MFLGTGCQYLNSVTVTDSLLLFSCRQSPLVVISVQVFHFKVRVLAASCSAVTFKFTGRIAHNADD